MWTSYDDLSDPHPQPTIIAEFYPSLKLTVCTEHMPSPKENHLPTIHFQMRDVSFREGNLWTWTLTASTQDHWHDTQGRRYQDDNPIEGSCCYKQKQHNQGLWVQLVLVDILLLLTVHHLSCPKNCHVRVVYTTRFAVITRVNIMSINCVPLVSFWCLGGNAPRSQQSCLSRDASDWSQLLHGSHHAQLQSRTTHDSIWWWRYRKFQHCSWTDTWKIHWSEQAVSDGRVPFGINPPLKMKIGGGCEVRNF